MLGAVAEVIGVVERDERMVRVVVVKHDERSFIRIESRKLEGGKWSPGRTLALRPEEGPGVIAALSKAIESVNLEPGRRRRLNKARKALKEHDRAHRRADWRGRTRPED